MFAEMEIGLVDALKASPLKLKLASIETLPDLDGEQLVNKFATQAPAAYVVAGLHAPVSDGSITVPFGIACVARNARGHEDARRGDGKTLGLYQIVHAVLGLFENGSAGGFVWRVTGVDLMSDTKLEKAGLTCAVVHVSTVSTLPAGVDESTLADFTNVRADFDIAPHVSAAEHDKWKADQPDYSSSKPDLQDQQQIQ